MIVLREDILRLVLEPGSDADVVTHETRDVALEDGCVTFKDTLVHHIRTIGLGDNWKKRKFALFLFPFGTFSFGFLTL